MAGSLAGCGGDGDGSPDGTGGSGAGPGGQAGGGTGGGGGSAGAGGGPVDLFDASFGKGGVAEIAGTAGSFELGALALGPEGSINVFALGEGGVVVRLRNDGQPDAGFGNGGVLGLTFAGFSASTLASRPDGKLTLGGITSLPGGAFGPGFLRLNADGTPDPSFGQSGLASFETGGDGRVIALAAHGDRLFGVGLGGDNELSADGALTVRVLDDGKLDTSFHAPDGYHLYTAAPSAPSVVETAEAAAAGPDGSLYACGTAWNVARPEPEQDFDLLLMHYTPAGQPDPAFGEGGVVYFDQRAPTPVGEARANNCRAIAVAPDGKLVVAGDVEHANNPGFSSFSVARFLPDGKPDPAFGQGGAFSLAPAQWNRLTGLVVLPDGSVFASGFSGGLAGGTKPVLLRLRADGTPDPSFGTGGIYTFDRANVPHQPVFLARQPDGKVVVAGIAPGPFVMRLNPL